ncbi:hypothetical protein [uncultured Kordia sp.]|uniref:hypothetical protein n=1 Tax=uncultured Kordia sp. TaxID=507699 RepID=UPI002609C513|nr:hypothetical protein [uncultured Kordia sp.]
MKKNQIILSLLCVLTIFMTACSSDDLTIEEMTLSKSEQDAIVKLVKTNVSIAKNIQITIDSVKLKKIDDAYYLSSYHGDEITTTLLKVENGIDLKYAGISCTSKSCATSDGCVPHKDGKKCTKCPWSADCTKIVTSDALTN